MSAQRPRRTIRAAVAPLLSVFLLGLLAHAPARAEYQELDAIVAVVEEDVILASEWLSRFESVGEQFAANNAQLPPTNAVQTRLVEDTARILTVIPPTPSDPRLTFRLGRPVGGRVPAAPGRPGNFANCHAVLAIAGRGPLRSTNNKGRLLQYRRW